MIVRLSISAISEARLPEATASKNKKPMKLSSGGRTSKMPVDRREIIVSSRLQDDTIFRVGGLAKKWLLAKRSNSGSAVLILKAMSRGILKEFL